MTDRDRASEAWWEGPGSELLAGLDDRAPSAGVEEQVLARCLGVVRRRRTLRRVRGAVLGGVLFLAGLAAGHFVGLPDAEQVPDRIDARLPAVPETAPAPSPDPAQTEMQAERAPESVPAEDLRLAGDQYLNERHDVTGAMRCYRRYLERLPEDDRTRWAEEDTWLLTSLRRTM